ncbi:uncharacterized protein LOC131147623 [Malania oleifera]|uniref:uncharacterized protein LOC131147623 n=1 Tax=Malania oleifera TaxID=397392 RepID=UPI0025ADF519|nr:uncharacterized protein LOC131147623 [Malania oleifera]
MSGGFFRGTSAEQDTRFSNKQAKLMKSQKFAPELDHLVDMTKVKMDVIRPWIATRVTELLGFEDEVLINFIYGLLDGKDVNGKQVQISLTGFMEKNTGKFMKELWALLLSAQKNASGVPQQFLDAKEEETRKKKAESDRIANEIQKKREKESRELMEEKLKKMDGGVDSSKVTNAELEPVSKHIKPRNSGAHSEDEKDTAERNGFRGRNRSPNSADCSPLSPRGARRSMSGSFSNSRSYSDERRKSRSVSGSPQPRGRSISSERVYHHERRRSLSPRRKHFPRGSISPPRQRSSHSRRRSTSRSRYRSPSPARRRLRSPLRRRSPSPVRRRSPSPSKRSSPSPIKRRSPSPIRRRSPSPFRRRVSPPMRRRSPLRRGSYSPVRRRSPMRRRSPYPVWRRSPSPIRRRSPSPVRRHRRRRSSSTPRHRSPSPVRQRSPIYVRRRSPTPSRRRPSSPYGWSSPSPVGYRSPSPARRQSPKHQRSSPLQNIRERIRMRDESSPVRHVPRGRVDRGPDSVVCRPPISMRSPQRDPKDKRDSGKKVPALSSSPDRSASLSESPPRTRKMSPSENQRASSLPKSPVRRPRERMSADSSLSPPRKPREQKNRHDSPETSGEEETNFTREDKDLRSRSLQKRSPAVSKQKDSPVNILYKEKDPPERPAGHRAAEKQSGPDNKEPRKKDQEIKSEKASGKVGRPDFTDRQESPISYKDSSIGSRQQLLHSREHYKADDQRHSRSNNVKDSNWDHKLETSPKANVKAAEKIGRRSIDSVSEGSDRYKSERKEKRKHKRSDRKEVTSDDDFSYDSEIEHRKEAKRRRREEKRLRKEEKRRRREERRRKREERRAEKLKMKSMDTVFPPSDSEKNQNNAYGSDGEHVARRDCHSSDAEETESEQKRLEIELRKKALESLRAKKGISH